MSGGTDIRSSNPPGVTETLAAATIGVAGAGGLGSNAAAALIRAGAGRLIIADFDQVESSNLNRQFFFHHQIGEPKVSALRDNLLKIDPEANITIHQTILAPDNIPAVFADCDILLEAFDKPEMKTMLAGAWMENFPDRPLIMASGLAGYGDYRALREVRNGMTTICGDQKSTLESEGGYTAPRVGIVANMQANAAIELLMRSRRGLENPGLTV